MIEKLNKGMVNSVNRKGYLKTKEYIDAFLSVKRHMFTPDVWEIKNGSWKKYSLNYEQPDGILLKKIYNDTALTLMVENNRVITTSSQPGVMAIMIEDAHLKEGDSVLEVGTGSGYNISVISNIVKEKGNAVSIELDPKVVAFAKENMRRSKIRNVKVFYGDGGFGVKSGFPYSKIIITTSASDITKSWMMQVENGGIIVLPLMIRGIEMLIYLMKKEENV